MKKFISILLVFSCLIFTSCNKDLIDNGKKEKYSAYYFDYFDTVTTIVGYEKTKEEFDAVCKKITDRLSEYHKLFDIYTVYENVNNLATVNEIYDGGHKETTVDEKIIELLKFSKEIYEITDGQVNVAMGSVLSQWHRYREDGLENPSSAKLPPEEKLLEASLHTDINNLIINEEKNTVYLADSQMTLDVGAVAKGYTVEKIAQMLENDGVTGYILNVGGNVRTIGRNGNGEAWSVGIENPGLDIADEYIAYLHLGGEAVVTSGAYQRYYTVEGKNYHHIIDPKTLMPAEYFQSVSIVCKDSGMGDALSTALFTMNLEDGMKLVENIECVEAVWVYKNGEMKYSSGFENYTFQ